MFRRIFVVLSTLIFAAGILATSLFRSVSTKYAFSLPPASSTLAPSVLGEETEDKLVIDYAFVYPGKILPDHPLWPLKALRDRFWLIITRQPEKKAELKLLFSDKRLVASRILFERNKPEIGYETLTKGEKYLEEVHPLIKEAGERGVETGDLLNRLATASLKHRQEIDFILELAPADARPQIAKTQDYSKTSYKKSRDSLNEQGLPVPENPFESD